MLYQKQDVTHERFGRDIGELIEVITVVRRSKRREHAVLLGPWSWIGAMAASVLTIICVGAYYIGVTVLWPGPPGGVTGPSASQVTIEGKNRSEQGAKAKVEAEAEAKRRADEETARRDPALSVTPGSPQNFRDRLANGQPCPMCPEMVVAPAGSFMMGSPASEPQRYDDETQVGATIARPFAVARFAVTFAEWDACVADGGCKAYRPADQGWGPRQASGDQCVLERCQTLHRLVERQDRQDLSLAIGGGARICDEGRYDDPILVGGCDHTEAGELRWQRRTI